MPYALRGSPLHCLWNLDPSNWPIDHSNHSCSKLGHSNLARKINNFCAFLENTLVSYNRFLLKIANFQLKCHNFLVNNKFSSASNARLARNLAVYKNSRWILKNGQDLGKAKKTRKFRQNWVVGNSALLSITPCACTYICTYVAVWLDTSFLALVHFHLDYSPGLYTPLHQLNILLNLGWLANNERHWCVGNLLVLVTKVKSLQVATQLHMVALHDSGRVVELSWRQCWGHIVNKLCVTIV